MDDFVVACPRERVVIDQSAPMTPDEDMPEIVRVECVVVDAEACRRCSGVIGTAGYFHHHIRGVSAPRGRKLKVRHSCKSAGVDGDRHDACRAAARDIRAVAIKGDMFR